MEIESKYKIIAKIVQTNDDVLLNESRNLVGLSKNDFCEDMPGDVKAAVNKAKDEINRGEGMPHSQVMDGVRNRFLNK